MAHEVKKFEYKKPLEGLSDNQISQHRDILYVGYVNKTNEIEDRLKTVDKTKVSPIFSEFGELKREEIFATNGMRLHEWYFGNLGGSGGAPNGKLAEQIKRDFGSIQAWEEEFKAAALCARGWVVLAYDLEDGKLHNYSSDYQDTGGVWGVLPVLVLDVYEHAYLIDYGVKRAPYVDAFMKNIDWSAANNRLEKALGASSLVGVR